MAEINSYLDIIRNATAGEAVRDAIIQCMNTINADGLLTLRPLTITSDQHTTYHPGSGKAYNSVTVDIQQTGEPTNINFAEFNVTNNTENGEHTPETEGYDENTYFNKVNVDIDPLGSDPHIADYLIADSVGTDELGTFYDAAFSGYTAMKRVYFSNDYNLPDNPGPGDPTRQQFNVTFINEMGSQIGTFQISRGGSYYSITDERIASPTSDNPDHATWSFSGWEPNPVNVMSNMSVYATYASPSGYTPGEVEYTWEEICNNTNRCDTNAPIGSYKYLTIRDDAPVAKPSATLVTKYNGNEVSRLAIDNSNITSIGMLKMIKVAAGVESCRSIWLSAYPLSVAGIIFPGGGIPGGDGTPTKHRGTDYKYNAITTYLNTYVMDLMPNCLKQHIVNMNKKQYGSIVSPLVDDSSAFDIPRSQIVSDTQKIWLPSLKEISHLFGSVSKVPNERIKHGEWYGSSDPTWQEFENTGQVYSVWHPEPVNYGDYGLAVMTRSDGVHHSGTGSGNFMGQKVVLCGSDEKTDPSDPDHSFYVFDFPTHCSLGSGRYVPGNNKFDQNGYTNCTGSTYGNYNIRQDSYYIGFGIA